MSALFSPSATLVNVSVFADYEIVANIGPSFVIHVVILKIKFDNHYNMQVPLNLLFIKMQNNTEAEMDLNRGYIILI